jgi:rod shape-determining protein MreB
VRNNKDPLLATPFSNDVINKLGADPLTPSGARGATRPTSSDSDESILHVGLDWGASKTWLKASFPGSDYLLIDECMPTVLGYAKEAMIEGILPNSATTLFGREALTHRRHLNLTNPTIESAAAAEFVRYLRSRLAVSGTTEIRAVIAVPITADGAARDAIRKSLSKHFQSVILLPQPFLTALGLRDESRLLDANYNDPIRHSVFIDIGAAATTLCIVQGYYPTADEQLSFDFAGNRLDEALRDAILENHPEAELSPITIRHLKEQHACAGASATPIHADVVVSGKAKTLDLTHEITSACNELLTRIVEGLNTLIARVPSDSATELLENVIVCGGGSRIKNIDAELARVFRAEGFESARVRCVGESYKHLAAAGALKAARQAREHHWQQVAI